MRINETEMFEALREFFPNMTFDDDGGNQVIINTNCHWAGKNAEWIEESLDNDLNVPLTYREPTGVSIARTAVTLTKRISPQVIREIVLREGELTFYSEIQRRLVRIKTSPSLQQNLDLNK